jgi:KDO2-lipid IV(A) lauroyltransferase
MLRLLLALLWVLRWLPPRLLDTLGRGLGWLAWHIAHERRQVALTNLGLCFPQWSEAQRQKVAREHFHQFATTVLSQGLCWFAPLPTLRKIVQYHGWEHLEEALKQGPVILLTPHFFGIDLIGITLSADINLIAFHSRHKNLEMDQLIHERRLRWKRGLIFNRQDGIRPILRALKPDWALYYLPDLDLGPKESVFSDFFKVPAATITALPRLARVARAQVVPLVIHQDFAHGICKAEFLPAWEDYPTADEGADLARMNRFIEEQVLAQPAYYLWTHKRFKTRPEGEASFYPS